MSKLYAAALYPTYVPTGPIRAVLFCGPHAVVVEEAHQHFCGILMKNPAHAGRSLKRVDVSVASAIPDALQDVHAAPGLFGAPPIVSLSGAGDSLTTPLQKVLDAVPYGEKGFSPHLVILKGGDLSKKSRLRAVFEKASDLLCVLCYPLDARVLRPKLRADLAPQTLEPDAEQRLLEAFATGDVPYTSELEKVRLLAADAPRITMGHVEGALSGVPSDAMAILERTIALRQNPLETLSLCWAEGMTPVGLIRMVQGTLRRLASLWELRSGGLSLEAAMPKLSPPAWPRDRGMLEAALRAWPASDLLRAMDVLMQTEVRVKQNSSFAEDVCARGLYDALKRGGQ